MKPYVSHQKYLLERLKDVSFAAGYLNAVLEQGDTETFLMALRNVADSQGGMKVLADKAKIGRETLYKMLSSGGNPGIFNLQKILDALGFKLSVLEKIKQKRTRQARLKKAS